LDRPIEGDWPYIWIDATDVKVRSNGRIVSVAIAIGVNTGGRREVLGMDIGPSEAETFWSSFLRKLARRGLGIKAAVSKALTATWQRCRVHCMRNALAHAGKSGRRVVAAFIATAFAAQHMRPARERRLPPGQTGSRKAERGASCPSPLLHRRYGAVFQAEARALSGQVGSYPAAWK
jgi:putative transposase